MSKASVETSLLCIASHSAFNYRCNVACMQDILTHLISLAEAEDKGVRLRVCQLLQLIINNQVGATCYSCRPLKYVTGR